MQETADLVLFTEEILSEKLRFLRSVMYERPFLTNLIPLISFYTS